MRSGTIKSVFRNKISHKGLLLLKTFTLLSPKTVTVTVHKGDELVKVLVDSVPHNAGTYSVYWDCKDEYGVAQAPGAYTVKVKKHNMSGQWLGAKIGNTSNDLTGGRIHHGISNLADISVHATKAVYAGDYSERSAQVCAFDTRNPGDKLDVFSASVSTPDTRRLCNDGANYYYAGFDAYDTTKTFIYATTVAGNAPVVFSSGAAYSLVALGDTYNVAALLNASNGFITGITVQAGNDYLIFCRPVLNTVYVINKNTGAPVQAITSFTNPKSVAFDKAGHLWVSYGTNTIEKFTVNSDGTLTTTGVTIAGIVTPGKIDVSFDSAQVGVIELSTNQLKIYSNADGSYIRSIGSGASYLANSAVADDKLLLSMTANQYQQADAFGGFCFVEADNSVWIADTGNNRLQHFSNTGTYLNGLMRQATIYTTRIDDGDPSRVFGQLKEFSIDYTADIATGQGWAYVNNWEAQIDAAVYNTYEGFKAVHTFANTNRCFGFIRRLDNVRCDLFELQANGTLRNTGIQKSGYILDKDGALIDNISPTGVSLTVARYAFTGLDGSNNPVWNSTAEILADVSAYLTDTDFENRQLAFAANYGVDRPYTTDDGKVAFFIVGPGDPANGYETGRHLCLLNRGGNTYITKAAIATFRSYQGDFPGPKYFEIGNGCQYMGTNMNVIGNLLITSYHGEFWKGGQTNKFNVYHSDGSPLLQWGATRFDTQGAENAAGMAGNALSPCFFQRTADIIEGIHGGESDFSAIHRQRLSGITTLEEEVLTITLPNNALIAVLPGIDISGGNAFGQIIVPGVNNWSGDADDGYIQSISGCMEPDQNYPDVAFNFNGPAGITRSKVKALTQIYSNWQLRGQISFQTSFPGASDGSYFEQSYIELLDNNQKSIARFQAVFFDAVNGFHFGVKINGTNVLYGNSNEVQYLYAQLQDFSIVRSGSQLVATYAGYSATASSLEDNTADISKPSYFRVGFAGDSSGYGKSIVLDKTRIYSL